MPTLTESFSSIQDQVLDLVKTIQEPTVDAIERVVESVEGLLPDDRPSLPFVDALPDPKAAIDTAFDYAEQLVDGQHEFVKAMLANQRDFAKAIVDAVAPLLPKAPAKPAKPVATKATKAA